MASRASRDTCMLGITVGKKVANWVEVEVYTSPSIDRDAFALENSREKSCMLTEGIPRAWMVALWRRLWLEQRAAEAVVGCSLWAGLFLASCLEPLGAPESQSRAVGHVGYVALFLTMLQRQVLGHVIEARVDTNSAGNAERGVWSEY